MKTEPLVGESKNKKKCNCDVCQRFRSQRDFISRLPSKFHDEANRLFGELSNKLDAVETDYSVLLAKIEGIWPADSDGKYYTNINDSLYEIRGIQVDTEQLEDDCEFDLDGGSCIKCGKL